MKPPPPEAVRASAPLPASFYARPADVVARDLIGRLLAVESPGGRHVTRIVETEAYLGEDDLACHASKGRTRRTETLYGPPGTAYVYLIYGMYHLFNVVALAPEVPHAVLVRAVEPLEADLPRTDGPGRLTRALGIDRSHDGHDLTRPPITLLPGRAAARVATDRRIGVDYAGAWRDAPLRFFDPTSRHLSRPPARGRR